jgi:hypothetical protein
VSTIPEYFFPAETHTLSSLNTLQNPIPGLLTPNDSLTSPDSPQLTHIVSRAASAETEGAIRYAAEQGSPLSRLLTLSSAASYVHPASVSPDNALGLTLDPETPLSPLVLPSRAQSDPVYTPLPQPEEEGARITSVHSSPSYHVKSPSPSPAPLPVSTPLVTRRASTPLAQPSPSTAVTQEETNLDNQENRPPTPRPILLPNPYSPPACTQDLSGRHPHQYYIIRHETHDSWRPVTDRDSATLLNFVSQDELLRTPPNFPTVIAFKGPSHHTSLVAPTDLFQARLFRIPTLVLCARAGLAPPTHDVPLGYIHYSFRASVRDLFSAFPTHVQLCFLGALIVSEIHDFLDGRAIYTYGHLRFHSGRVYIVNQAYYFDDSIRANPNLLRYTLSPRLPIDPFTFTRPFRDETPL